VAIVLDPAASKFRGEDGFYHVAGQKLTCDEMIERYAQIADRFPVWLIEDGLAEDDWDGWATGCSWSGTTSSSPTRRSSPTPSTAAWPTRR
jgi:enolase